MIEQCVLDDMKSRLDKRFPDCIFDVDTYGSFNWRVALVSAPDWPYSDEYYAPGLFHGKEPLAHNGRSVILGDGVYRDGRGQYVSAFVPFTEKAASRHKDVTDIGWMIRVKYNVPTPLYHIGREERPFYTTDELAK